VVKFVLLHIHVQTPAVMQVLCMFVQACRELAFYCLYLHILQYCKISCLIVCCSMFYLVTTFCHCRSVSSASRVSQTWPVSLCCGRSTALEPVASHRTSYQRQYVALFQASTEDVPASMSGVLLQMTAFLRNRCGEAEEAVAKPVALH